MLDMLKSATGKTYTENGATAYETAGSYVLDFFANGGALRMRSDDEVISIFSRAFAEDKLLALKTLFYMRDARGGQGERDTFKTILRYLANNHKEFVIKNIELIPYYGRWDDLYVFDGTLCEEEAYSIIRDQFEADVYSDSPSLLGKWMKSESASNLESKRLAKKTRKFLKLNPKSYREAVSSLRAKIKIVETLMSSNAWNIIDYPKLPSKALFKYRKAFMRHDPEGYSDFLNKVEKGTVNINTGTLYPYDIVRQCFGYKSDARSLNVMWDNLPNYIGDRKENSIAVVDTSGSMTWSNNGLPLHVAISLGIYLAERNEGVFHNHFMTFSSRPKMAEIVGTGIVEKVNNLYNKYRNDWEGNTDVEAVFDLILDTAYYNKIDQDEMIDRVYIISDMEFDRAKTHRNDKTLFEGIRARYEQYGYKMPNLVFWNVDSRNDQSPIKMNEAGVQLVSGASPSIFETLMSGKNLTAYDLMIEKLNSTRYELVTI